MRRDVKLSRLHETDPTSVVGLKKNLNAAIRPSSGSGTYSTIKSTTWSAPANAVASYNFGAGNTVAPSTLSALNTTTLKFFWTAGDNTTPVNFNVLQVVERSDSQETADVGTSLSYLVETPSSVSIGAEYSPTQDGKYSSDGTSAISSGTQLGLPKSAGIETAFKAVAPPAIAGYSGGGYFAASQVVASATPTISPAPPVADGCAIFATNASLDQQPIISVAPSGSVDWQAIDAPAQFNFPAAGKGVTDGNLFVDYFIYRPTGKNAIWVSLGTLSWSWAGTVTNNAGTFALSGVTNSSSATTSSSTTEPTWNSIDSEGQDCDKLPSQ